MPVRLRSSSCRRAIQSLPPREALRSSSSSGDHPSRMMPPSRKLAGGSSARADASSVVRSEKSWSCAARARSDPHSETRSSFSAGTCVSEMPSDCRSRALPEPCESREVVRSMSRMPLSESRHFASRKGSSKNAAIMSCRAVSVARSRSGCRIQSRNRRAPMGVAVRSSTPSSVCWRPERESTRSRLRCEAASMSTCAEFSRTRGWRRCSQGRRSW